ncbi:nucleotide sugar dehydrogenase [Pseudomonadales bacterium]|nr:nucleotide sugar dehydrogenase [Pseudomonadales bacterium]
MISQPSINSKIAIIGLGYVGLPLAIEFGKYRDVIGFDVSESRIYELRKGLDSTLEVSGVELREAVNLSFSMDIEKLRDCGIYIVTVPTPIDCDNIPDLTPLRKACETVAKTLKKGDVVIFESTVFPGCTEEVCVPDLERVSSLQYNLDFFCGYSPERINPGDKVNTVKTIVKITSGSTPEISLLVDELYNQIVDAGTYRASTIKVAEAAKIIENVQRDVNIALVNEMAVIFNKLDIDTSEVIAAAASKWNFAKYYPGFVGGHCISVDPYYLIHRSSKAGYVPDLMMKAREINNFMTDFVANIFEEKMQKKGSQTLEVLVLGLTFKENCQDLRNSKAFDFLDALKAKGMGVDVYDPWVRQSLFEKDDRINQLNEIKKKKYDGVIILVAHNEFKDLGASFFRDLCNDDGVFFDMKSMFPVDQSDVRI